MAIPLHADHLQPSDLPALAETLRRTQIVGCEGDADSVVANTPIARFVCPCAGILEKPYLRMEVCGDNNGPTTVMIEKNGADVLSAAMSIAHGDADGTEVAGAFDTDALQTVAAGDVITIDVLNCDSTNASGLTAGVTFVAFGRTS